MGGRWMAGAALLALAEPGSAGAAATGSEPGFTRAPFGQAADGAVELVTLRNAHGMTLKVSTRGGAVVELDAPDRAGRLTNVVLGRPDFAGWERAGAFNTVVGRFANRIGGGGFTLDGQFHKLDGADPRTGVVLHGGPSDYAGRLWRAEPFRQGEDVGVRLSLTSPDGDGGFPGEFLVTVTYTLTAADVVRLDYQATTTKPTVVNLTNHTYFALGGVAAGPVYDALLQLDASRYTPVDKALLPTGELKAVAGTDFDFRQPTRLGDRLSSGDPQMLLGHGIDHNFVVDGEPGRLRRAARLVDPRSGRVLEVRTTEPGVQVYTANGFNGGFLGADGRALRQTAGIAFETQHFPDSPNRPDFPSTVLRPGETFRSTTEWAFSAVAPRR